MLLRAISLAEFGTGCYKVKPKVRTSDDNDGHLFWDCTFHPFVELRNNPEFLASLPPAWLASWVDITVYWVTFGRGGQ